MSRAWLMSGKAGDLYAILPILFSEFTRTGEVQNLVVAREYASVVYGLDYVKPFVFQGEWWDFRRAYQYAKMMFDEVLVPQNHGQVELGKSIAFERKTPSAFLDMWERVGYLEQWDKIPLVLPRSGKTQLSGPTIFYGDHSQSSPFFFKEDLYKLIQDTFPSHQVMRASGMRLKSLRDFLPVMDYCDLIVSVETSFLHLAKACETPIIAFAADSPDPWRGSPHSSKFAFHCRYGDFEARRTEIVAAMLRAVNKMPTVQPEVWSTARPHGYNACISPVGNFYRFHYDGTWKTKLSLDNGRNWTKDVIFPKECDSFSLEDARFHMFKGQPHISYVCSQAVGNRFQCVQAYGPISIDEGQATVTKHIVPKYQGNDFSSMVKNWVFFEQGGKLFAIFGNLKASMEQVVLEIEGDKVVKEHRSPAPSWPWGGIRGGCVLPYKGQLLRFFHSRTGDTSRPLGFRYYIGASLMEPEPPFRTVMVSSFPIMAGNEKWTPNCHHVKRNVAICYGAIQDGGEFVISGGLNDCESFTMRLKYSDLNL